MTFGGWRYERVAPNGLGLRQMRPQNSVANWSSVMANLLDSNPTLGQRVADRVAMIVGSWPFLIVQNALFCVWMALNVTGMVNHWDPYPFILLNLVLSFQSAETGPVIMIASNRADAIRAKVLDAVEKHTELVEQHTEDMRVLTMETHTMLSEMRSDHRRILAHLGLT